MKHKPVKHSSFYKIAKGKIERIKKTCPRCGPETLMAKHKQKDGKTRYYCGKCRMTIWE